VVPEGKKKSADQDSRGFLNPIPVPKGGEDDESGSMSRINNGPIIENEKGQGGGEEEEIKVPEESKVGKKLSDLTTRKVILIVLAMLFAVPFFMVSTYISDYNGFQFGLTLMSQFNVNETAFQYAFDAYV